MSAAATQGSSDKFVMEVRGRGEERGEETMDAKAVGVIANVLEAGKSNHDFFFKLQSSSEFI